MFYDLDTELTYQCLPGYQRKGFTEAQCFFYNGTARDFNCKTFSFESISALNNGLFIMKL